jgi:broad specificity phosphatase PhoE
VKHSSTTLYLVQHAQTPGDGTPSERNGGWSGVDLSDEGVERAQQSAQVLEGREIGETYSSDLRRASHTAAIIHEHLGLSEPNTERQGLRPLNVGILTGVSKEEAAGVLDDAFTRIWAPVTGGESVGKFLGRWGQELHRTIQEALGEDHACAYITHSHNLRALEHLLSNGVEPLAKEPVVGSGGIIALHIKENGAEITPEVLYNPEG